MNNRIKQVRISHNLTQQEFADRIGCSRSGLANYEAGRNDPINPVIVAICREFHVNETWLRTGIGVMQAEVTEKEKLTNFFGDVLSTAPDERSAFLSALADLPPDFWPLVVDLAKGIAVNIKKKED